MRFYRWLLGLCPTSLRREYGTAMEETFTRRLEDARAAGPWRYAQVWRRELTALLALIVSERWGKKPSIETNSRRGTMKMTGLWNDARFALRGLLRAPGFTAVTIGTLALGIGATTAIFTVVNGVLLKPLPFEDQDALVHVWNGENYSLYPEQYLAYRDENSVFEELGVFSWGGGSPRVTVTGLGDPERVLMMRVTAPPRRHLGTKMRLLS